MATFQKVKLGDYLDLFNGKAIKAESSGIFPVYGSNGKIGYTRNKMYKGSIVLGRVGAYCGSVMIEKGDFWASDNTIVVKNNDKSDLNFLYYVLKHLDLNQYAGGAAQPLITHTMLRQINILAPDLTTQSRIASVLSSYDDLIENNEKRIKTLEEMAQLLYTEWFVKFKFPGHEKMKMVDSGTEFGMIPEGWDVGRLGSIIELAYGKALKEEDRIDGNVLVFGSSGCVGTHNQKLVGGPGIVVGRKGNAGAVHWVDGDFYPIDTTYYVKSSLDLYFIYYLLKDHAFVMGDVAVPGLNRNQAYLSRLLIPTLGLIEKFAGEISPMFSLIQSLNRRSLVLRYMRDLLIPQLVTGKRILK